ncbi:hypothetical protein COT72_03545 [archaeon CG10_big_fil_rev_8_21_14_0_10_43_11]|nr:MAG: hypothetical protein COT72_03545 [archaeon CG10_big_fil_rev_8_21_14_0_10_43_11]
MMREDEFGILQYVTQSPGVGGTFNTFFSDFIVEERDYYGQTSITPTLANKISDALFFLKKPKKYVHATLVKQDYTTLKAVSRVEKEMRARVGYAGLKDKRAITAQRISIPTQNFHPFKEADIRLNAYAYSNYPLTIGALWGNRFKVILRDTILPVDSFVAELSEKNFCMPNFYGKQRFGNGTTHRVGKFLVKGDFEHAAKMLLTNGTNEPDAWRGARKELFDAWPDIGTVELPQSMWSERQFLARFEGSFKTAFLRLRRELLSLYVHAYQSYLFNRCLSKKIREHKQPVTVDVPGYRSGEDDPDMRELLEKEDVSFEDFQTLKKQVSSAGEKRKAFVRVRDFRVLKTKPVTIRFTLKKGSYATILLNELIKP